MEQILEILFKCDTSNTEDFPSPNILRCLGDIKLYFDKKGIHSQLQEYDVVAVNGTIVRHANLLAFDSRSQKKNILLQGHVDTVPFEGEYQYKIGKEEISGRGAVDMKGPLAAAIKSFESVYQNPGSKYSPALLITGDEEANGFAGINHFLENNSLETEFAINCEPTNLSLSKKLRGVIMYEFEKSGQNGHSSSTLNDRLIEKIIPLINKIEDYITAARDIVDPEFGPTVAAFTVINSGIKANQLPSRAKIFFNLRTVAGQKKYHELFDRIVGKLPPDVNAKITAFDPVSTDIGVNFDALIKKSYQRAGLEYKESTMNAFTEASILNLAGIPTVICGAGDMLKAHCEPEQETIKVSDLKKYQKLLEGILGES